MLTLAGRLATVLFGLSLFLVAGQAIWADNDCPDEVVELGTPDGDVAGSTLDRVEIIHAKAPPKLLRADDSAATPVAGEVVIELPSEHITSGSHRRRVADEQTSDKSSRRSHAGMSAVMEPPIERLRHRLNADVDVHVVHAAPVARSTLTQVMRRLAGWNESCPMCGKPHAERDAGLADVVPPKLSAADREMLGYVGQDTSTDDEKVLSRPLRAGEPAQVILDTQRRLGKSVLDGTEFGGSPEMLIQWIRALDDENRRQQAILEEVSRADSDDVEADQQAVSRPSQIESLRSACRQLQGAADSLEDQNLFEAADSIRGIADGLRRQSRTIVSELETKKQDPAPTPDTAVLGE
jgi:hypothetical protein